MADLSVRKMFFEHIKVLNVVDGDTLDVEIDLGFSIKIKQRLRLLGLDTAELRSSDPELRAKALLAKNFLKDCLIDKTNICLYTIKTEKYGRYLAEIYLKEEDATLTSVNDLLLDNGLAEVYLI